MKVASLRLVSVAALALALAAAGAGCTNTPTVVPSRDFNRPTDMVFACVGAFATGDAAAGTFAYSGRPMDHCHPFGMPDPAVDDEHHTYVFVPNTDSGELTIVDADTWKLVDLDPSVSGYSRVPLGVFPEQIAVSDDGCRVVTANRGSCDLSLVDPAALMAPVVAPTATNLPVPSSALTTIVPTTASGRLLAAPQEIQFLPQDTQPLVDNGNLCTDMGTYGAPAQPGAASTAITPWRALVTFPTCDLIATIELPSGMIIDSRFVRRAADGTVTLEPGGADPHCPADCGAAAPAPDAGAAADSAADAGAADAGDGGAADGGGGVAIPTSTPAIPYLGPSGIAIQPPEAPGYGIHAFVSLANLSAIVTMDVSPGGVLTPAATIPLAGAAGSNRIRLSVNRYEREPGGKVLGRFVGDPMGTHPDRRYLYVIARDGSLRVVSVASRPETECETNIDPLNPPAGYDPQAACVPVTADSALHRRPFSSGPGLTFGSVPIDVGASDVREDPLNAPPGAPAGTVLERNLTGTYAWVVTSSGNVFLLNIDPVARSFWFIPETTDTSVILGSTTCTPADMAGGTPCEAETLPPVNSPRNGNVVTFSRALSPNDGPARVDLAPVNPSIGPRIATAWAQGTNNNATALTGGFVATYAFFPDPAAVAPQTWTASWQGPIVGTRFTGQLSGTPSGLEDFGLGFCGAGIQVGDLVTFTGCTDDNQCGVGRTCIHGPGATQVSGGLTVNGVCVEPDRPELVDTCALDLSTARRYLVTDVNDHRLSLLPHPDELAFSSLAPCPGLGRTATTGGAADGGGGAADGGAGTSGDGGDEGDDCSDPTDSSTSGFRCVDVSSAGIPGMTGSRCLMRCTEPGDTTGCRAGRICIQFGGSDCSQGQCFCADGPALPMTTSSPVDPRLSCGYDQLTAYKVSAGRAFVVSGSALGLPMARTTDANGQCGGPISTDPRMVTRISLDAPQCVDANGQPIENLEDSRCPTAPAGCPSGLFQLLETMPSPNPCLFLSGPNYSNTDPNDKSARHVSALFRNTQVAFSLTSLERGPANTLDLRFDVHGGFRPQTVIDPSTVEVTMPARIVLGPIDTGVKAPSGSEVSYLFVVDQRALGRGQAGGPTRGQLLRIHPLGLLDSNGAHEPWFEDFNHSNNLFPIR